MLHACTFMCCGCCLAGSQMCKQEAKGHNHSVMENFLSGIWMFHSLQLNHTVESHIQNIHFCFGSIFSHYPPCVTMPFPCETGGVQSLFSVKAALLYYLNIFETKLEAHVSCHPLFSGGCWLLLVRCSHVQDEHTQVGVYKEGIRFVQ